MFSSVIRLGTVLGCAAVLASCGGSSGQALTQQSTPEGLFTGTNQIEVVTGTTQNASGATVPSYTLENQSWLVFMEANGSYYAFYSQPNAAALNPSTLGGVQQGTMTFGGGGMAAANVLDINFQPGLMVPGATSAANFPSFNGAYNTGLNIAGTFTYSNIEYSGTTASPSCQNLTSAPTGAYTVCYNLPYNADYQKTQNLSTLAGSYKGTVATSVGRQAATFTFSPASVQANAGNQFGVATVSGTGADGCTYSGTVSPLFKGNGYNLLLNSGNAPCVLPNTQFSGLVYLDTTDNPNQLYSFSPNAAHSDGVIFVGTRI
ncbi:MAG: hypothetical protein JO269_05060 [Burkholderiaceae bacterium]|nr:hypothetical protein [Burkholderiaceae bacterium]